MKQRFKKWLINEFKHLDRGWWFVGFLWLVLAVVFVECLIRGLPGLMR
jgi:hypothetical protein